MSCVACAIGGVTTCRHTLFTWNVIGVAQSQASGSPVSLEKTELGKAWDFVGTEHVVECRFGESGQPHLVVLEVTSVTYDRGSPTMHLRVNEVADPGMCHLLGHEITMKLRQWYRMLGWQT